MRKRLVFILFKAHTTSLELFLMTIRFCLGLWFVVPFASPFSINGGYRVIASLVSETVFGSVLIAVSLTHAYALLSGRRFLRRLILLIAMFIWTAVGLSFTIATPMSTGVVIYFGLAIGNFFCLTRPETVVEVVPSNEH